VPSYRVELAIGAVKAGVNPGRILPAAADAASGLTIIEASDITVVTGQARIVVRFAGDDADVAAQIGTHVANVVAGLADVSSYRVTERVGNRWYPVP
jgi:hypothetical protein